MKVTKENAPLIRETKVFPLVAENCADGTFCYTMNGEVVEDGDYLIVWPDGGKAHYKGPHFEINYVPA